MFTSYKIDNDQNPRGNLLTIIPERNVATTTKSFLNPRDNILSINHRQDGTQQNRRTETVHSLALTLATNKKVLSTMSIKQLIDI